VQETVDAIVVGGGPAGLSAVAHDGDQAAAAASQRLYPEELRAP
jgi:flavin-dependent dehydrogenase